MIPARRQRLSSTWKNGGELWEDIYDVLISESRRGELTVPWEELKAEMTKEEKPRGNV